jgi:hypothetical protein
LTKEQADIAAYAIAAGAVAPSGSLWRPADARTVVGNYSGEPLGAWIKGTKTREKCKTSLHIPVA